VDDDLNFDEWAHVAAGAAQEVRTDVLRIETGAVNGGRTGTNETVFAAVDQDGKEESVEVFFFKRRCSAF